MKTIVAVLTFAAMPVYAMAESYCVSTKDCLSEYYVLKSCTSTDFAFTVDHRGKQGATVIFPNRRPAEFIFDSIGDGEHTFVASGTTAKERLIIARNGSFKYIMDESTVSHEWTGQCGTAKEMDAFNKSDGAAQRAETESAAAAKQKLGARLSKLGIFDQLGTFWDQFPNHTSALDSAFSACRTAKTFDWDQGLACRKFATDVISASGTKHSVDAQYTVSIAAYLAAAMTEDPFDKWADAYIYENITKNADPAGWLNTQFVKAACAQSIKHPYCR